MRLPANDCAMRFASSRSFADGAVPLNSIVSSVTLTAMLELVRVGSLRNAVWMSFFTWSLEPLAEVEVVPEVLPAAEPTEEVEPDWSALALGVEDELALGVEEALLLGEADEELLVPGVVLVDDCELIDESLDEGLVEEDALVLGLLLLVVSGVEVLPLTEPVVLFWLDVELPIALEEPA